MGKSKNNFSENQDTQPIHSLHSSPSHSGEEKDRWIGSFGDEFMQDTVPFEDDAWISDEYRETQVIDNNECDKGEFLLCCETRDVGLGFGTQEEPPVEGEQTLQCFDGLDTQVLDGFDEEVVIVADTDDDSTVFLEDNCESEVSDCGDSRSKRGNLVLSEDKSSEKNANENVKSMDAVDAMSNENGISGKVARFASVRSAAFRASAVASRVAAQKLLNSECSTLANCHLEQNVGGEVENEECPPNMCVKKKIEGNRAARKLFPEDDSPEPGLSYVDSQEPGEASQTNALEFVDKLITESGLKFDVDVDVEDDCGRRTEEKSKSIPSVKGPQELAKKVSYKARAVGSSIFDWDDTREDEGGGDICRRRRDEIFGVASKAGRSMKKEIHESHRGLGVAVDKRKVHSDSKLLHRSVIRGQKMIQATRKNLGKELDAVSDEHNKKISDMRDLVALGYDKQAAAEAIDAVCSGDDRNKVDARLTEEREFCNGGVITRQSKGTKRIHAMGKGEMLKRRMKKASPSPAKPCGTSTERSSKRRKIHTASRETKKNLVDEFDRREEEEAGFDTQMAAEAINDLHSGDARGTDNEASSLIGKKSSRGGVVVTRKLIRMRG